MANFRSAAALFAAFSMFAGSSAYAAGQSNADVASESVDIAFDYQRGALPRVSTRSGWKTLPASRSARFL